MRTLTTVAFVLIFTLSTPQFPRAEDDKGVVSRSTQPLVTLYGRTSNIAKGSFRRIESLAAWKELWVEHQAGSAKTDTLPKEVPRAEVDFARCFVIAVFQGNDSACNGYKVHSVTGTESQVIHRVEGLYFQTGIGIAPEGTEPNKVIHNNFDTSAWGIFVLPRTRKTVTIEEDVRSLIQSPPVWKKQAELKARDVTVPRD